MPEPPKDIKYQKKATPKGKTYNNRQPTYWQQYPAYKELEGRIPTDEFFMEHPEYRFQGPPTDYFAKNPQYIPSRSRPPTQQYVNSERAQAFLSSVKLTPQEKPAEVKTGLGDYKGGLLGPNGEELPKGATYWTPQGEPYFGKLESDGFLKDVLESVHNYVDLTWWRIKGKDIQPVAYNAGVEEAKGGIVGKTLKQAGNTWHNLEAIPNAIGMITRGVGAAFLAFGDFSASLGRASEVIGGTWRTKLLTHPEYTLDEAYQSSKIAYTSFFQPAVQAEFVRRYRSGENPAMLVRELGDPLKENILQNIFDPAIAFSLVTKGGSFWRLLTKSGDFVVVDKLSVAGRSLTKIDDAAEAAALAVGDAARTVSAGEDLVKAVDEGISVFRPLIDDAIKGVDDLAKSTGLLAFTPQAKAASLGALAHDVVVMVARGIPKDQIIDTFKAWAIVASNAKDTRAMRWAFGMISRTAARNTILSPAGLRTGQLLADMMLDASGNIMERSVSKISKYLNLARESDVPLAKLMELMAPDIETVSQRMFPDIASRVEHASIVQKLLDDKLPIPRKYARFISNGSLVGVTPFEIRMAKMNNVFGKVTHPINRLFAGIYMGISPGYAFRNLITNTVHSIIDWGTGPWTVKMSEEQIRLFGMQSSAMKGFIGGPAGTVLTEESNKWYRYFSNLSARFERWAGISVYWKAASRTMDKMLPKMYKDIDPILENAGFLPTEIKHIKELIRSNGGDVQKGIAAFQAGDRATLAGLDDALVEKLQKQGIYDDVVAARRTSETFEEFKGKVQRMISDVDQHADQAFLEEVISSEGAVSSEIQDIMELSEEIGHGVRGRTDVLAYRIVKADELYSSYQDAWNNLLNEAYYLTSRKRAANRVNQIVKSTNDKIDELTRIKNAAETKLRDEIWKKKKELKDSGAAEEVIDIAFAEWREAKEKLYVTYRKAVVEAYDGGFQSLVDEVPNLSTNLWKDCQKLALENDKFDNIDVERFLREGKLYEYRSDANLIQNMPATVPSVAVVPNFAGKMLDQVDYNAVNKIMREYKYRVTNVRNPGDAIRLDVNRYLGKNYKTMSEVPWEDVQQMLPMRKLDLETPLSFVGDEFTFANGYRMRVVATKPRWNKTKDALSIDGKTSIHLVERGRGRNKEIVVVLENGTPGTVGATSSELGRAKSAAEARDIAAKEAGKYKYKRTYSLFSPTGGRAVVSRAGREEAFAEAKSGFNMDIQGELEARKAAALKPMGERTLIDTPEFKTKFQGSKVVDEKGQPQRIYIASKEGVDSTMTQSGKLGIHMTAKEDVAELLLGPAEGRAPTSAVIRGYAVIRNPFVLKADPYDWNLETLVVRLKEMKSDDTAQIMAREIEERLDSIDVKRRIREINSLLDPKMKASRTHSLHGEIVDSVLKNHGYDGMVYKRGFAGDTYVVFDQSQILSRQVRGAGETFTDSEVFYNDLNSMYAALDNIRQNPHHYVDPKAEEKALLEKISEAEAKLDLEELLPDQYRTLDGSVYSIENGRTRRMMRLTAEGVGGPQGVSTATIYLSSEDTRRITKQLTTGTREGTQRYVFIHYDTKTVEVVYLPASGRWENMGKRVYHFTTEPSIGSHPLEVWDDGAVKYKATQQTGYKKVKFGEEIVEVGEDARIPDVPLEPPLGDNPVTPARAALHTRDGAKDLLGQLIENGDAAFRDIPYKITPQQEKALGQWAKSAEQGWNTVRSTAMEVGKAARKFTLLDYADKRNLDVALAYIYPYQFWYTRTYANWISRLVKNPYIAASYARYKDTMSKIHAGMPDWWKYNVNTNDLFGLDSENPLFFNLEATLNPLNGIMGVDFDDPDRNIGWFSRTIDALGKGGPSIWTPISAAIGVYAFATGRPEAGGAWLGRAVPLTGTIRSATSWIKGPGVEGAGPVLGSVFTPSGIELDPSLLFQGGLTKYDRNRVGRMLGQMQAEGMYTEAQIIDAATSESGQIWDEAVRRTIQARAGGTVAAGLFGVGFKARTEKDIIIDQMYDDLMGLMNRRPDLSPVEYKRMWGVLRERYPFMDTVLLSRKGGEERDVSLAYNVLARIPPGSQAEMAKLVGLDYRMIDKFESAKGSFVGWADTDVDIFKAKILQLAAVLAVPDTTTRHDWNNVKYKYSLMNERLKDEYGDDILDRIDGYYTAKDTSSDEQYLMDNPDVADALNFKMEIVLSDPEMNTYYGGIDVYENYLKSQMRSEAEELFGPDIWKIYKTYQDIKRESKDGAEIYKNDHSELLELFEWKDNTFEKRMNQLLNEAAGTFPEAPALHLRPDADIKALGVQDVIDGLNEAKGKDVSTEATVRRYVAAGEKESTFSLSDSLKLEMSKRWPGVLNKINTWEKLNLSNPQIAEAYYKANPDLQQAKAWEKEAKDAYYSSRNLEEQGQVPWEQILGENLYNLILDDEPLPQSIVDQISRIAATYGVSTEEFIRMIE